jgi:Ca2+-binding RTX toxin-like protein
VINKAVSDAGAEALQRWVIAHPEDAALLSQLVPPVTVSSGAPAATPLPPLAAKPAIPLDFVIGKSEAETAGNDLSNKIMGDSRNNKITGLGGNDTLDGVGGSDTLMGGAGDDVYIVPNSLAVIVERAGEGIDTVIARGDHVLSANVENLTIDSTRTNGWAGTGNELNNRITGNVGNNRLEGGAGGDTLSGGGGIDTLIGGAGNDLLTGGAGADVFRFSPGGGKDVIVDMGFGPDRDTIDISAYLNVGLKPVLQDVGPNVLISFSSGDSITVQGLHCSDLASSKVGWVF